MSPPQPVNLGAVVVQRDDSRFLLDIVPTERIRSRRNSIGSVSLIS